MSSLQSSAPSGARNAWPCEHCGTSLRVAPGAGRVPPGALAALAATVILFALLSVRFDVGGAGKASLALAALLLTARLGLLQRARTAWVCPACRRRTPARLRHAGPLQPAVLVPALNNARSIAGVLTRIAHAAPDLSVLVVDDGSTDGTGVVARTALAACGAEGEVLVHPRNRGKGAALRTGFAVALERGFSHVITLDADGQHYPEDLPRLREALARAPTAIVVGARDLSGDNVQASSRFGRRFSNFWLRLQTGVRLADSQSGFRAYPVAPVLSLGTRGRSYDFEVEVLIVAARAGIPLVSEPIRVYYPPPAERTSHFDMLWDNVRISWVNMRLLAGVLLLPLRWPARLSTTAPPLAKARAWSGRSRGGMLGHLFFFAALRLVGRRVAYLFLYPVAFYFVFAARRATEASRAFLDAALGPASARRRFWRSYRHLLTFAQCLLDRAVTQVSGGRGFTWDSIGHEHIPQGQGGALLVSAHLGNYEVGGALLHLGGVRLSVVMLDAEVEGIKAVHARFGARENTPKIIAVNRGELPVLDVLAALRDNEVVALHGDRIVDDRWVSCDFLGRPAPFPTGIFLLAAAARVPIVLTFGFKEGPTHYRFIAEPPRRIELPRAGRAEALAEHARWYASRLEWYARRYPYQWFNFYDFWCFPAASAGRRPGRDAGETPPGAGRQETAWAGAGRASIFSTKP